MEIVGLAISSLVQKLASPSSERVRRVQLSPVHDRRRHQRLVNGRHVQNMSNCLKPQERGFTGKLFSRVHQAVATLVRYPRMCSLFVHNCCPSDCDG